MAFLRKRSLNGKLWLLNTTAMSGSGGTGQAGGGTTTPPVTTAPLGNWDALTPYSQVAVGWKNASTTALPSAFVTTNHRAQRGDIPAGSRLGLFTASGTEIPSQQDNEAPAYSDGSLSSATISAILPDTLAATGTTGDTLSYFVKAVPGSPNRTPKFTLAAWGAANDLRIRISTNLANLADATAQYEFRVSDAIAAGLFEGSSTGSDYPLTSIRVDRSGQVAMGWKLKGFARRVSDGAYHRTLTGEFYVTATGTTSSLIEAMLKQPMATTVGKNAAQTVGPLTANDLAPVIGVVQIINNGTVLRTWGGPNDYRAGPVTIDLANNQAVFPTTGTGRSRNALGYVFTSTGTLPGGVLPNVPYFTYQDYNPQKCWFTLKRAYAKQGDAPLYQSNTAYDAWQQYGNGNIVTTAYTRQDDTTWRKQQVYACTQAGTTANSPPSGNALDQVDGTAKWSPLNLFLTSTGSGTISVYPVVHIFHTCGAAFVDDQTTDPIWTGSGPAPHVEVIKDLTYLCRYARAFPPYDLTLTPLYETGLPFDGFSVSEPYTQATLDAFGDDPGTNLIGYLNVSASNALLNQTSVQVQRHQRAEALGWADHWTFVEDAKSFQPVVGNAGPGNAAGKYPGLAPSLPGFWYDFRGATVSPAAFLGFEGLGFNGNWYDAKYGTPLDGSHLPAFWILSYEKTGRSIFLDHGISLANGALLGCYKGNNTTTAGSRQYYNTSLVNQQVRGSGWVTRTVDCLDDVLPVNHVMRQYFTDYIQDGLDFATAVIEENRVSYPESYATGMMRVAQGGVSMQMWMMAYQLTAIAQASRKARNPGWRTVGEHLATKLYLPIYDDAVGGSAGLIDWNNFRGVMGFKVLDTVKAGDVFTTVFNYDYGGLNGDTAPAPISYTAQAGQTPAQVATAICNLINSTASITAFGFQATPDSNGLFRTNNIGGLFSTTSKHGAVGLEFSGPSISARLNAQSFMIGKLGYNTPTGLVGPAFSSVPELLAYNLGVGWPQSGTTRLSLSNSTIELQGSNGWVPWDTTGYPNAHWAAMAVMVEAGFPNAQRVYDAVTARIQQTGGGPRFSMIPYSRFSPDGSGRTYNNFNLVTYALQATRTGH